jgi:arginine exporter protein ArgO
MTQRAIWFLLGAAVASLFWIAVMKGIGQEWLDILLTPG